MSYKKIIDELQKGHFENPVINLLRERAQTVSQSETINQLFDQIRQSDQHIFAVIDNSRLVGVISRKELAGLLDQTDTTAHQGHH